MPLDVNYDEICSKFDRLISEGIIKFKPSHPVAINDNGMTFCFNVVESLNDKPQAGDPFKSAQLIQKNASGADEQLKTFGPGSDLAFDHPDICITKVNDTHWLVINKFPVFRPMLLLLTVDSFRRQHEPLDAEDMEAAWSLLSGLEKEHYVFFNCTVTAGSSRAHKHLQVIPAPGSSEAYSDEFKFFPDYDELPEKDVPSCVYFIERFRDLPNGRIDSSHQLIESYRRLLQQTTEALNITEAPYPHNLVLTKRWMVMIPRREKVYEGLTANAPGMVGSVYVQSESDLDKWKQAGPANVLAGLGIPRTES